MIEIVNAVDKLAEKERESKTKEKGVFVDFHHAYGVIREEVDEMEAASYMFQKAFDDYWDCVKDDCDFEAFDAIDDMNKWALQLAAEAIQVSAMCKKTIKCLEKGEGNE